MKWLLVIVFAAGRSIEATALRPADITIAKNNSMKIDLGSGKVVEFLNGGPAQWLADLFVWLLSSKAFWAGNPFIAEAPAIPMLFDGYFVELAANLKKMYDFLPADAIVVPGHVHITTKSGIKYTIDYVAALQSGVEAAVNQGLTLGQTQQAVTLREFYKDNVLFDWLHGNFNLQNAHKDISSRKATGNGSHETSFTLSAVREGSC